MIILIVPSFCIFIFCISNIRFGEDALHSCEVMLHDLEVSRRLNAIMAPEMKKSAKVGYCLFFRVFGAMHLS
jgi:hypothetical protein